MSDKKRCGPPGGVSGLDRFSAVRLPPPSTQSPSAASWQNLQGPEGVGLCWRGRDSQGDEFDVLEPDTCLV